MRFVSCICIIIPICAIANDEYTLAEQTFVQCVRETDFNKRIALMHRYFTLLRKRHTYDRNDVDLEIAPTPPGTSGQSWLKGDDLITKGFYPTRIILNPNTLFGITPESRRRSCINAIYTLHHELGHAAQYHRIKQKYDIQTPDDHQTPSYSMYTHNYIAACKMADEGGASLLDKHLSYPQPDEHGPHAVERDADRYACHTIDSPCLLQKAFEDGYVTNTPNINSMYLDNDTQWNIVADRCRRNPDTETLYKKPFWNMPDK